MPGRFEGLSTAEWELFEDVFPEKAGKGRGMPAAHPRRALNSLLFILMAGCRCCGLPRGGRWASKSAGHRWLKAWHSDGRLKELQARLLGAAQNEELIFWRSGAADGSFFLRKRLRYGCAHGYEGKGVVIHLLADAEGMPPAIFSAPANEDERKHAGKLLAAVAVKTGKAGRPRRNARRLAADKGHDADPLRSFLKKKGIQPQIPRKRNAGKRRGDGLSA